MYVHANVNLLRPSRLLPRLRLLHQHRSHCHHFLGRDSRAVVVIHERTCSFQILEFIIQWTMNPELDSLAEFVGKSSINYRTDSDGLPIIGDVMKSNTPTDFEKQYAMR
eukprot:COSAG01_NODE_22694_length_845_cov_1.234584_1_plen_108_part_10